MDCVSLTVVGRVVDDVVVGRAVDTVVAGGVIDVVVVMETVVILGQVLHVTRQLSFTYEW